MTESDRQRYITLGAFMVLAAGQALYAGSLLVSIGNGRPLSSGLLFGVGYALFIYFIDRSIVGYIAPWPELEPGDLAEGFRFGRPRNSRWGMVVRVFIAICASVLMGEAIMLQVFSHRIEQQVAVEHIAQQKSAAQAISADFEARIAKLRNEISAADNAASDLQQKLDAVQQKENCQLYGGPGCGGVIPGAGPLAQAAKAEQRTASAAWQQAAENASSVRAADTPQIAELTNELTREQKASDALTGDTNDMLTREDAFWHLTQQHPVVAFWRIVLSLLLLGIDLAPLITKLTAPATAYEDAVRAEQVVVQRGVRDRARELIRRGEQKANSDRVQSSADHDLRLAWIEAQAAVERLRINAAQDIEGSGIEEMRKLQLGRQRAYFADMSQLSWQEPLKPASFHVAPGSYASPGPGNGTSEPVARDLSKLFQDVLNPSPGPGGPHHNGHKPSPAAAGDTSPRFAPTLLLPPDDDIIPEPDPSIAKLPPLPPAPIVLPPPDRSRGHSGLRGELRGDRREWQVLGPMPGADQGSSGAIWLAASREEDAEARFVIKTVPVERIETMGHTGLLKRRSLYKEVGMRVRHPNIGEIVDSGKDQDFYFHVSPLYSPGSLSRYCAGQGARRELRWCAQVVLDTLAGLIAASREGFVHLDIKPGNLVLDGQRIRIIDWGLSRNWQDEHPAYTHVPRGSVFFASPEQIARPGHRWDTPLADLYGVGAVFYWLVAGEAPLQRDVGKRADLFAVHQLISTGARPRRVDELLAGVPAEIGELIDMWLSYEPERRVPAGTSPSESLSVARRQLNALRDRLPVMTVGIADDRGGDNPAGRGKRG